MERIRSFHIFPVPQVSPNAASIPKSAARRIWLHAQRLDTRAPFGAGPEATRLAVEQLGYVQIDTIHVIERCHHHILFTRIPDYAREHLHQAQSIDKAVFEYRAHALAYLPAREYRHYRKTMNKHAGRLRNGTTTVTEQEYRKVLARIRKNGSLTLRDIDDDVLVEKDHAWASRKPSERALRLAFYAGALTVSERNGILKTYELTNRHFGWEKPPKPAGDRETLVYLLDRALRSQGLVSLDSICHLDAPRKPAIGALIRSRVSRGELVAVDIEGAGKQEYWAAPEALEMPASGSNGLVHILSPFDPLVIQRKRLKLFFDYEHVFEAYVPKPKRKFGYFALPVLVGDEIVAAIDLKTDRENRKLLVQQWTWVGTGSAGRHKRVIEDELNRFEQFQLAK